MLDNYIVSLIRTWVPVAVGSVLTWLAANAGIVVDSDTKGAAIIFAVGAVSAVYYALARAVEHAFPALGRVLLSLGLSSKRPAYVPPAVPVSNDQTAYPSQRRR